MGDFPHCLGSHAQGVHACVRVGPGALTKQDLTVHNTLKPAFSPLPNLLRTLDHWVH